MRRALTWLALGASLGAGLLFVVVRVATPSDGARVGFYAGGWSADGVRIAPIDAPAPGLQAGDLVRAVDGRPLDGWARAALDPSVARPAPGAASAYDLVRDGGPLTIPVSWSPPALGATLVEGWGVILFSIATAAIAAYVFARRPDEPAATALVIAACGAAGSSLPWLMGVTVSDVVTGLPFVLHSLVTGPLYMLMWPAGIDMAIVMPAPLPFVRRHPAAVPAVYAITLGAYGLMTLVGAVGSRTVLEWVGTWPLAQVAVVVPSLAASIVLFATRSSEDRSRRRGPDPARFRGRLERHPGAVPVHGPASCCSAGRCCRTARLGSSPSRCRSGSRPRSCTTTCSTSMPRSTARWCTRGLTLGVLATYVLATAASRTAVVGQEHGYGASLLATGVAALVALPSRDRLQHGVNRLMYGPAR